MKLDKKKIRRLASFSYVAEYSDFPIEEEKNLGVSIAKECEEGNMWAWCNVRVTAEFGPFSGVDALCCVSCKDEEEFVKEFFGDMSEEASYMLLQRMQEAADTLENVQDLQLVFQMEE